MYRASLLCLHLVFSPRSEANTSPPASFLRDHRPDGATEDQVHGEDGDQHHPRADVVVGRAAGHGAAAAGPAAGPAALPGGAGHPGL